jgi:membrane protein DedA with SNARE-associated domain
VVLPLAGFLVGRGDFTSWRMLLAATIGATTLGARVVPGAHSVVSIPAGTSRMPLLRFNVLTTIGSPAWNAVLIGAGVVLGNTIGTG